MLYPYHLSDIMVKGLRVTPFSYYTGIMEVSAELCWEGVVLHLKVMHMRQCQVVFFWFCVGLPRSKETVRKVCSELLLPAVFSLLPY